MYVMSVKEALSLIQLHPHEHLKKHEKISTFVPGMITIFISHQWVGFKKPDPRFVQFAVLQRTITNIAARLTKVCVCPQTVAFFQERIMPEQFEADMDGILNFQLWYDYFSIPQDEDRSDDFMAAVLSIPAYVELCEHFWVLAPYVGHLDKHSECNKTTWNKRGWCRMESAVHAFTHIFVAKKQRAHSLTIFNETCIGEAVPMQWLYLIPGEGDFQVDRDRVICNGILKTIVDAQLERFLETGNMFYFRFIQAASKHLIDQKARGLEEELERWLASFRFKACTDSGEDAGGWAPIHYAALQGHQPVIKQLVNAKSSVDSLTLETFAEVGSPQGSTPLIIAASYIADPQQNTQVVKLLLELKADTKIKNGNGFSAFHCAAQSPGGALSLRILHEAGGDVEDRTAGGDTPLSLAAHVNCTCSVNLTANVQYLTGSGASTNVFNALGWSPLMFTFEAEPEASVQMLEGKADPNFQAPDTEARQAMREQTKDIKLDYFTEFALTETPGCTAMHLQAYVGNYEGIQVLLDARGDPTLTNWSGMTPVDIMRLNGNGTCGREKAKVLLWEAMEAKRMDDEACNKPRLEKVIRVRVD